MSLGGDWMTDFERGYNKGAMEVRQELGPLVERLRRDGPFCPLTGNRCGTDTHKVGGRACHCQKLAADTEAAVRKKLKQCTSE